MKVPLNTAFHRLFKPVIASLGNNFPIKGKTARNGLILLQQNGFRKPEGPTYYTLKIYMLLVKKTIVHKFIKSCLFRY